MNDERMQPLLEAWLRDRDEAPRDVRGGVARVTGQLPQTRQRGRWWPLPAFERPMSTFPTGELAPVPIPATNGPAPARGFTMFSALKLVVASVIVALFGGFLLAGVLTTQHDGQVIPGEATASPETSGEPEIIIAPSETGKPVVRTDVVPDVELTVEAVEPGVYRIIDDGVREPSPVQGIVFGLDGGLWSETDDGLFRLGGDLVAWPSGTERSSGDDWRLRGVTPEGVIWTSEWEPPGFGHDVDVIRSYDGERWTVRKQDRPDIDLEIGPDGTVYGLWYDPPGIEGRPVVARYGADGWEQLDEPFDIGGLFADDDGGMWVRHDGGLSAYRDGELQSVYTKPAWTESREGLGQDGTPSARLRGSRVGPRCRTVAARRLQRHDLRPGRLAGVGPDDILRSIDGVEVAASPEGDLWTWRPGWPDPETECDSRPSRYDGERWASYLPGRCVEDLTFAPDGSLWVLAGVGASGLEEGDPFESHELYVITPEAPGTPEEMTVRCGRPGAEPRHPARRIAERRGGRAGHLPPARRWGVGPLSVVPRRRALAGLEHQGQHRRWRRWGHLRPARERVLPPRR